MGIISQAEREYISHGMSSGHRNDGRSPHQFRPLELDTGVLQQSSGSARCQIGSTSVLVSVRADVGVPSPETPDHGILDCAVAISPCAFKGTAADNLGQELGKIIQKSLKWQEAGLGCAIDLTALSIVPGKRCWSLLVDGLVVSADGNLLDALSIATKAALADLRIPRMEVTMGEDGEEPDLELDDDPELAASLDTTRVPLILTISQGGSASVVDLTEEEEEACSSSAIHVAVTAQGNVCGIHKPGAAAIQPGRLMEMIGVGQTVGSQLHKAVASELYRLEQQQAVSGPDTSFCMRILIKGGVWKNTEDEILKAAVMKYGLNQWARISSLLVRKSAKQCKARWYEWLDPSIKKTEWTREEDEKLLHLAKLMPTQWRTIAPIVGRTAAQCLERYDKLLDAATAKDESYDPADDPRRLRAGEIDPNPEGKPARPDPVDMDEDEKEMLSEARARLANTRGKKAKRKAREKQLEEARRLASLQKKRELKAAGIEMRDMKRKTRGINYNNEVAFEKKPTAGFYDVGEERQVTKEMGQEFRPVTLEEMEGKRRKDIEKNLMKQDEDRDARKAKSNQPAAVAQGLELNDASGVRRRGKMMLPAPQVSEAELEAIARGAGGGPDADMAVGAGGETTRGLLGNYDTPARFATPMRTPRILSEQGLDRITMEAQNQARERVAQTPLLGGEDPQMHPSDFSGATPRPGVASTPNPLLGMTPRGGQTPAVAGNLGATPGRALAVAGTPLIGGGRAGPSATPSRTPARDAFGLNSQQVEEGGSRREVKSREAAQRLELRSRLAGLPQPENEYSTVMPELPDAEEGGEGIEEDAADLAARKKREAAAREAIKLKKRSQVMQRGLPRPEVLSGLPEPASVAAAQSRPLEAAEALLQNELIGLLHYEAAKYPTKQKGKRKRDNEEAPVQGPLAPWEDIPLEQLDAAAKLLAEEVKKVHQQVGHSAEADAQFLEAWQNAMSEMIYLPGQQRYGRIASATNSDKIASLQFEHEAVKKNIEKEEERYEKLEKKLKITTHGYVSRDKALTASIHQAWTSLQESKSQLKCFQKLAEQEERTIPVRLAVAQARLQKQKEREAELQERYKEKSLLRDDLTVKIGVLEKLAAMS